jgi:hypothetical protein
MQYHCFSYFEKITSKCLKGTFMQRISLVLAGLILLVTISENVRAELYKSHVAEFTVTGAANSQELKKTLQGILASRLNPEQVQLVENQDQAELLIIGSYAQFGRMFSMDVAIKSSGTGSMTKVFEQGQGEEDIIPAVGRLARKVDGELTKRQPAIPPAPSATATVPAMVSPQADESYVIRREPLTQNAPGNWSSAPLEGVFTSIADGRTLPGGERELYLAGGETIRTYLKGRELKMVAETAIPRPGRILAIDTADLDKDGLPELYVSIIDRNIPASRVYQFNGSVLVAVAEKLPWLFRGVGPDIASRTIYAQELDSDGKYYGNVKELSREGDRFTAKNPLKLPRTATVFNFNRVNTSGGPDSLVVLNKDGYLVLHSPDGSEVWKSSEKYGGSEMFFNSEQGTYTRSTADLQRWTFLEQRMIRMKDGILLVPRNEGTFSYGNNRSFDKHTLIAFEWTGAVLREKWHTRTSPGYLADFAFDPASAEVILLEVVQKAGMFSKGTSVVSINRIE